MSGETKSFLDFFNLLEEKLEKEDVNSHIIIGIDLLDQGIPGGMVIKVQASPLEIIAAGELLKDKIEVMIKDAKDDLKEMEAASKKSQGIVPDSFRSFSSPFDEGEKSQRENMSDMLKKTVQGSDLPDAIKSQILKLDEEFKAAMEIRDISAVLKVLGKMQEIKKQMRDSGFGDDLGNDDNFDLNNFK
jgi:hypothetical protein